VDRKEDWNVGLECLPGLHHAFGHDVGAREGAAEIDHQAFHAGFGENQGERRFGLGISFPADLGEIGRAAAEMRNHIHGRHGQPGAVGENADVAVELDVAQAFAGALPLPLAQRFRGGGGGKLRLANGRRIIETELAVERHDPAVDKFGQRVDLEKLGIARKKRAVNLDQDVGQRSFRRP
jgi:hypothetical protein